MRSNLFLCACFCILAYPQFLAQTEDFDGRLNHLVYLIVVGVFEGTYPSIIGPRRYGKVPETWKVPRRQGCGVGADDNLTRLPQNSQVPPRSCLPPPNTLSPRLAYPIGYIQRHPHPPRIAHSTRLAKMVISFILIQNRQSVTSLLSSPHPPNHS